MTGAELSRRTTKRLTPAIVLSNIGGAVDVFFFTAFLLPIQGEADPSRQRLVNGVVLVLFLTVAVVVGRRVGIRIAQPVTSWLESEQPPTETIRRSVLRQPLWQMYVNGSIWMSGAVVFGLLNLTTSARVGFDIALTIVLGGFTTCTISYLLAERILRPVVSRAMDGATEPPPVLLGVKPRLLLAWGVGSGIPLVGIGMSLFSPAGGPTLGRFGLLFLVVVGITVGFLCITAAAGAVSDPVRSVAAALREVGQGQLDAVVPVYDASEVGRLQSGFNAMVEGLREREKLRDLFGRQVGGDVARLALERGTELGGELREVAVLFVDIVGSTELAVTVDPQEVVRRLNAFFGVVIDVVQEHGGWVNKFEGDAALCIFGAPVELPDAGTCALAAARSLACRLEGLEVDAAIGVCAGPVVAGHVGAESRFEYTVIGDPVNAAARLTELAKTADGCVLADAAVLTPGSAEAGHWSVGESVVLRGRTAPTTLARPRSPA
ncbi:MAG: adenylate/guanylate cyclase with integral rane sensor [Frankiales bacterium]|nr:adenylate/guanylate cyclase with integral rane sensor [Frankiales bacterium]